jgi:hypothetical protein
MIWLPETSWDFLRPQTILGRRLAAVAAGLAPIGKTPAKRQVSKIGDKLGPRREATGEFPTVIVRQSTNVVAVGNS